jgi:hypothetical protein
MPFMQNCPKCGCRLGEGCTRCWATECDYVLPNGTLGAPSTPEDLAATLLEDPQFRQDFVLYACHGSIDKLVSALKQSELFQITDETAARYELSASILKKIGSGVRATANEGPLVRDGVKTILRTVLDKVFSAPTDLVVRGIQLAHPPENWSEEIEQQAAIKAFRNQLAYRAVDDVFDQMQQDFETVKAGVREFIATSSVPSEARYQQPIAAQRIAPALPVSDVPNPTATGADENKNNAAGFGCLVAIPFALIGFAIHPGVGIVVGLLVFFIVASVAETVGIGATVVGLVLLAIFLFKLINGSK